MDDDAHGHLVRRRFAVTIARVAEITIGGKMKVCRFISCIGVAVAMLAIQTACWAGPSTASWVGSWSTAPTPMTPKNPVADRTFRSVAHLSLGGSAVRIAFTNQFGSSPLSIGAAHVGMSAGAGKILSGSDHVLTFNHQSTVSIPAHSYVISDPVQMNVEDFADVAISVYIPQQMVKKTTCHYFGLSTTYVGTGNTASQVEMPDSETMPSTCFLESVLVQPKVKHAAAIVALGDSITDGTNSTVNANRSYPDDLAVRLHAGQRKMHLAVLNEGIGGNRVLFDGFGPSALARFDRDVLAQPGVRYLIYLEGINDIYKSLLPDSPEKNLTANDLILAATQVVTRAHLHGIKVMGGTIMPTFTKHSPDTPKAVRVRGIIDEYNNWVRTSNTFDAVVDFNKATADPADPDTLLTAFDSGDHVHPNDAGYQAMANAINLSFFR